MSNVFRAPGGPGAARVAAAVALSGLVALCLPPAAGATGSAASTASALNSAQAQAQALESQIAAQQLQIDALSERYDQAGAELAQVRSSLTQTAAALDADRAREAADRHQLQVDAVNAYIYDEPVQNLEQEFSSENDSTILARQYQATAIGNVAQAVADLQFNQAKLTAAETTLAGEQQEAAAQAAAVQSAEQEASAANAQAQVTLTALNGEIAQLVAEQAAERAAAAAAAAKAAASEAAKKREAQQAAEAAQVAQAVGSGTPAADQATSSANQAAAAAGGPSVIGSGQPEPATGAGSVAVAAAERYLGVPYQWGGASMSGVDCSGLTMLAWEAAGVDLPHSAALQYEDSTPVPLSQVQPGDLLFYDLEGTGISHVVMYVGSGPYGAQTIIQAAETGTVVSFDPYWTYGLVGAGRP